MQDDEIGGDEFMLLIKLTRSMAANYLRLSVWVRIQIRLIVIEPLDKWMQLQGIS